MVIHISSEYAGRLTEWPGYDWGNAPFDPECIPRADVEKTVGVAAEHTVATEALAQAVPAVAEMRQASAS